MFKTIQFPSRTPAGVPISDPFAEVRLLKTFARLGVYSAILIFVPIDVYLIGFSWWQTAYIQLAYVGVATAAIELTFAQSLKLRKRSAYPARMLVEAGTAASVQEAERAALSGIQRLLGARLAMLLPAPGEQSAGFTEQFTSQDAGPRLADALRHLPENTIDEHNPTILQPDTHRLLDGLADPDELVAIIPVVAFTRSFGVLVAVGDSKNRDLKDVELLRGIGNAIGLAIESLRQKEEIQAKEERLRAVVTSAPVVLFNTDLNGVITLLEGRGLERLDTDPRDMIGRSVFDIFADAPNVLSDFARALAGETVTITTEFGDAIFEAQLCPAIDAANRVSGIIGVATDVTERKQAEEIVRHMAYHDSLTGLPNRELFERKLVDSLALAKQRNSALAVIFVDLDGFKSINDTAGHAEGDRVLKEVANKLTALIREGDLVARIGGDEFLVLLPEVRGVSEATAVSVRILEGLQSDWIVNRQGFRLSASLGIAVFPDDGEDADALTRAADRAMYLAKDGGRGRYALAQPV